MNKTKILFFIFLFSLNLVLISASLEIGNAGKEGINFNYDSTSNGNISYYNNTYINQTMNLTAYGLTNQTNNWLLQQNFSQINVTKINATNVSTIIVNATNGTFNNLTAKTFFAINITGNGSNINSVNAVRLSGIAVGSVCLNNLTNCNASIGNMIGKDCANGYVQNGSYFNGTPKCTVPTAGAGGNNTQIQYNSGGVLTGSPQYTITFDRRGPNETVYGNFTGNSAGWTLQSPAWIYFGNKINKIAGQTGYCQHNPPYIALTAGDRYEITYNITNYSGSGSFSSPAGIAHSSNGVYTEQWTTSSAGISFSTDNTVGFALDDIIVRRVYSDAILDGSLSVDNLTMSRLNMYYSTSLPIAGTILKGTTDRTWIAIAPGTGGQYSDLQVVVKGTVESNNYNEFRVGYDSENNQFNFITAGHGTNAGIPFSLTAIAGQSSGGETPNIKLLTDGKNLFGGLTSSIGTAKNQFAGTVLSRTDLVCSGNISNSSCSNLSLTLCATINGCALGSYACEGTHASCSGYNAETCLSHECTVNTICSGTHTACSNYDQTTCASHSCTENWYDPMNCACNNAYCENGACGDPGSCTGDPCYSVWHDDTMNCGCGNIAWGGCTGDPHICQQSECDASSNGCSNVFSSCSGSPHICQQSECDAGTDGCSMIPYSCDGTVNDINNNCVQLAEANCDTLDGCNLTAENPSICMTNELNGYNICFANDGSNNIVNSSTGGTWFTSWISATDVYDRTAKFDKKRGKALNYIQDSEYYTYPNGSIDHTKFYGYTKIPVPDKTRPVYVDVCINKTKLEGKEVCTKTSKAIDYPYNTTEDSVSMSNETAMLRQAVYDLKKCVICLKTKNQNKCDIECGDLQ